MKAEAYAKVNLALAVFARMADGFHPLRGIFQSISLSDDLEMAPAGEDEVVVSNDEAPADFGNLAWRGFDAVRRSVRVTQPARLQITKRIPAGAGLGGGSADAAAAIGMAAARFGLDDEDAAAIAESIGADVPFSLVGGTCLVEGRGERVTPQPPVGGFALAVVVPPFAMATPDVYRKWDELGGPQGEAIDDASLPPSLRGWLPMRNDLYPAAVALDERIGDWRRDLAAEWGTAVAMTGSGSALFAFFPTIGEARSAAEAVTVPVRLATAAEPVDRGWSLRDS